MVRTVNLFQAIKFITTRNVALYSDDQCFRERRILAAESYLRYSALKARWKELLKVCPPLNDGCRDSNATYLKEFEDCEESDTALSEVAKCIGQEQLEFMKLPALVTVQYIY